MQIIINVHNVHTLIQCIAKCIYCVARGSDGIYIITGDGEKKETVRYGMIYVPNNYLMFSRMCECVCVCECVCMCECTCVLYLSILNMFGIINCNSVLDFELLNT